MKFRNLTPHPVTINGWTISPEPVSARVEMKKIQVAECAVIIDSDNIFKAPLVAEIPDGVSGLPPAQFETYLIVSTMVFDACPDRLDLAVLTDLIRDAEGKIVDARALRVRP